MELNNNGGKNHTVQDHVVINQVILRTDIASPSIREHSVSPDSNGEYDVTDGVISLFISKVGAGADTLYAFMSWDFNIFSLKTNELLPLSFQLVSSLNLLQPFRIENITWIKFVLKVEYMMSKTKINPYHNYRHVVDVMHTCYLFLTYLEASEYFRENDIFVLMISALIHDLEHPGANNAFQVNSGSPLAILYNDISVLENHHVSSAFANVFVKGSDCNVLSGIDDMILYKEIRKNIITCVLATDMSFHFGIVDEIKAIGMKYSNQRTTPSTLPSSDHLQVSTNSSTSPSLNDKDRITFLKTILHAADISNPAKVWSVAKRWSDLVVEEFFEQGDQERALGLSISPNMDRHIAHQDEISIGFIDYIVAPQFLALAPLLPKVASVCSLVLSNHSKWHELLATRLSEKIPDPKSSELLEKWDQRRISFEEMMNKELSSLKY